MSIFAFATEIVSNERAIGFARAASAGKVEPPGAVFVAELDPDLALAGADRGPKPFERSKDSLRSRATSR